MTLLCAPSKGCNCCNRIKEALFSVMGLTCLARDECGQSGGEADSDEDVITDYHLPVLDMLPRPGPLPTISVTPHSPANKTYPVLEDSLQQVRELHENVQHMRNVTVQSSYGPNSRDFAAFALNPLLAQVARLSASCPVLNETIQDLDVIGGSLGSSPLHQPPSRKGSGTQDWLCQPETQRRRSWTALEDLTGNKDKIKHTRQRSISLSSMESEADESSLIDNVDGSTVRLLGPDAPIVIRHRGTRGTGGGASTHSLNEADLQNDFNKLKAKREAEQLRLLPARLPLQKSISTPSIIAVRDLAPEPALAGAQPTLPLLVSRGRPSGTESETEEEGSRSGHAHYDPHSIAHLHHVPYDRHSEKRRKRGSLFFRKKKDKTKKATHQWVSGCYGTSQICDVCTKPLSNKPALYCEGCGTTVHQNTCKDNIQECAKKNAKSTSKLSGFAVPLTNAKNSIAKRGSASLPGSTTTTTSQILCDDKDSDSHHGHHDSANFPDDVPIIPLEFLSDSPLTAADLCSDFSLGLHETEPDSWSPYVGKEISRKLKEKEVKRQEHIYEFILTEKHHCMTLLVMQKVFVDGLQKYFQLGPSLERMFPRLLDLTELHLGLLSRLRQRQRENPVVSSIADILLEQFSDHHASKLKSAYGEFCSRHRDAVEIYKYYLQNDQRFGEFVRHCQTNPLLKKKGIPECILFVTQRLTKYPLLIEPLIKTSKENRQEQEALQRALSLVKEVLVEVDAQVAEKEKEDRKLEIYNRIDAKSYTVHRGDKFKKSDILQGNRALKFEGVAMLMQGRGKMQIVLVIVLSDVLFFLQENSHKYTFFTPDNKAGVVSLQKLLVREKAGQDSRGIYLISSNPTDPEMFELKVHKPKDKQIWIQAIREAVQSCPEEDEDNIALSSEERQNMMASKQNQVRHLVGLLRQKDIEQALLLEEKMSLQLRLLAAAGLDPPSPPSYRHLVNENADTGQMWKEVLTAVQEVSQLASSLYTTGTNLSRSVSSAGEHQSDTYVSPILPKRAETFGGFDNCNPGPLKLLGKKLSTSSTPAGTPDLDNIKPGDSRLFERLPYRNCVISGGPLTNGNTVNVNSEIQNQPQHHVQQSQQLGAAPDGPALLTLGREQQYAAIQLSHYVYTLLCIISQLMTTNESLQAQITTLRGGADSKQYRHNQQLEELRNFQDRLSGEKAAWAATRDQEVKELEEKKAELLRLQEQIRAEQNDITQQREQLYRKMEVLTSQGLLISPNVAIPVSGLADDSSKETSEDSSPQSDTSSAASGVSSTTSGVSAANQTSLGHSASTAERRKDSKWTKSGVQTKSQLPLNLISATNQQKVSQNVSIKQQIPLKLASRLSSGSSGEGQKGGSGGPQQMLPLKLSQDEKIRRTSTSGYQRLGSDNSFSPPSGDTTPTSLMHSHTRTGSSPAMMQASPPNSACPSQCQSPGSAKASRTHTYPKLPDKFKQQPPADEEVIYF
ncbi:rho guanine nucleotide exchange factor 18 isoform X1 [Anoplophora glabripennis]|nr:rho guanine nucleotide exchange factor 18 isoform X1 [Anoplophora glabripennis]XP_018579325.1 rho guanine nucleotide exchange factor 18 isoform X1 [Anoplophora glabripennis]XP_018579326.1 rho guanine nucleotide exchange factor 18 isoform X1 [Anoplophora glabripennis]XP_018579327.1 rho guanine nucleotide exchange factor 18 isoform X1 [Anoplophora glabripennis]